MSCANFGSIIIAIFAVYKHTIMVNNQITVTKALNINRLGDQAYNCRTLKSSNKE